MRKSRSVLGVLAVATAGWLGGASAQEGSAEIMMLTGKGTAANAAGAIRSLAKGQPVYAGEVVSTGVNSYMNLHFKDGSYILLRPSSRFQIEQFKYEGEPVAPNPEPAPSARAEPPKPAQSASAPTAAPPGSRAFFRLLRGGFRAVSGLVGKSNPNEYRVSSPVATIGIRGTDYETFLCDAVCQKDPIIRDALNQATAGRVDPALLNAAAIRAQYLRARTVKVVADDDNLSQLTYTHEGEVNQMPPGGGAPIRIPKGTGAITTHNGFTGTFEGPPPSSVNAPNPKSKACN